MTIESAVIFECSGEQLVGILHSPPSSKRAIGVVIIVGGPQYRVGSHRQFVQLARALAKAGYPVFRFDYRGMGDSSGETRDFRAVDDDIRVAIDTLMAREPTLSGVVLMGLCDAASAALIYVPDDSRVEGLILVNPWVRTEAGLAKAYVEQYYGRRFLQKTFWRKILSGRLDLCGSLTGFLRSVRTSRGPTAWLVAGESDDFIARMRRGLAQFGKPVLLLLSGRDLTAQEFVTLCRESQVWRSLVARPNVVREDLPDADHTFSTRAALESANASCSAWLESRVGR